MREPALPNRAPLFALYAANVVSVTGNVMATIGIPWFVLQTTGSVAQTGITAAVSAAPAIVGALAGGVFVDRVGFKRTSVIADTASMLAFALIPAMHATVGLQFWQLLALVFVGNLFNAPGDTARRSLAPELANLAHLSLERMSAFNDAIMRSSRLIGAPLAGVLVAVIGASNVLWMDAATFLVSAVLIGLWVPTLLRGSPADPPREPFWSAFAQGARFLLRDQVVLVFTVQSMLTYLLDTALNAVILPVYALQQFGSAVIYGTISGVTAGAALVMALFIGAVGMRGSRRWIFGISFLVFSLRYWLLALYPSLPWLLLGIVVIGLALGCLNPIVHTVEFERIPADLRARVFGVITALISVAGPLGGAGGFLLESAGMTTTLIGLGAVYVATAIIPLMLPVMRGMERPAVAT